MFVGIDIAKADAEHRAQLLVEEREESAC